MSALIILVLALLLPGVQVAGFLVALAVALIIGLVNAVLRPILILLTLPVTILTLGLFTFVIDAFLVMLSAWVVPGFAVNNFWWALLFAVVLSIANSFIKKSASAEKRQ